MNCQPDLRRLVYNWLNSSQICLLCDEPSEASYPLCMACEADLPWLEAQCETCALPVQGPTVMCEPCRIRPPAFTQVIAPWRYEFPVDSLVTRFKHRAKWPLGRLLGELFSRHLRYRFDEGLEPPDLLLPVPLAKKRLRERGFNQAAMLAGWIGNALKIPSDNRQLLRLKETPPQQGLDARARKRNLRDAFALRDSERLQGMHVALIDDVLTTGATADGLARLLLKAGAQRVDVYCLARTPSPRD